MREVENFCHALRFLTILPVRHAGDLEPDWLIRSVKYFPLIGILIGACSALILFGASRIWSGIIPALLAIGASAVLTGALHEDGLADSADALLGSGRTRERCLAIMKDSRLGTYGALALGFGVALRVAALGVLPFAVPALIAAHAGARCAAGILLILMPYAGDRAQAKIHYSDEGLKSVEGLAMFAFTLLGLGPLIVVAGMKILFAAAIASLLVAAVAARAKKMIGGITGDVLGAAEQIFEIGFLLTLAGFAGVQTV
jgi:adenosylcobinamide-GDP ribazoletransferase